jgi:predicted phosphodiesterase
MRYLILSDIHANLEALEAVLAEARDVQYEQVLVLGDLVGYGPDPNAVIDRVLALEPLAIVRGNHDKVTAGVENAEGFNRVARQAAEWTLAALTPEHRALLAALEQGPAIVDDWVEICHGTPADEDEYITGDLDAFHALKLARRPICVFGHTHIPVAYRLTDTDFDLLLRGADGGEEIHVDEGASYLVNPGSVGQPRDADPRAAFGVIDTTGPTIAWIRVAYPVAETQAKILAAGLPAPLADRLALGR